MVTDEEAFQFFVGALDEVNKDDITEEEEEHNNERGDVLLDIEESDLIYNVKPRYISSTERQRTEDEIYFFPSIIARMFIFYIAFI